MAEYIEREALMRRIKEIHCAECDSYNGVRCRACWVDDTLDYIGSEPTADVAPVVHGHFVHDGPRFSGGVDWWHCSSCGRLASGVETRFCYCPFCGAKMDGGNG